MNNAKLILGFLLALVMAVMQSAFFPGIHLLAFVPFLAIVCFHSSFCTALWLAALAGTCQDFLVSHPSGVHVLQYTLLCFVFFRWHSFFKEHPLQLPLFSFLISFCAPLFELVILFLFAHEGKQVIWLDWVTGPFIDGIYAFFWFVGPFALLEWIVHRWKCWKTLWNPK